MILIDVNILIYAFREDSPYHKHYHQWLNQLVSKHENFALSSTIMASFLRITTHPAIFKPPTPLEPAMQFIRQLNNLPTCIKLEPNEKHLEIFLNLCKEANAKGNLIPDAWIAALAMAYNCHLFSSDGDFSRFKKLQWTHLVFPSKNS